jgi:hypothetical protein
LFAGDDVVDMNGLDGAMPPSAILMAVAPFVTDKIDGSHLPS